MPIPSPAQTAFDAIHLNLKEKDLDLRVEVILSELISDGLRMEDVVIFSQSVFTRNYRHDLDRVEEREFGPANRKRLCFFVNRDGVYDALPEDLFHQPQNLQAANDADVGLFIDEIHVQAEREKGARDFFLPLENEFYHHKIKLELEERRFLFETNSNLSLEFFDGLWNLQPFLTPYQKNKLCLLMPWLYKVVGNISLTTLIFKIITGDDLSIKENQQRQCQTNAPYLGFCTLGFDLTLGGTLAALQSQLVITVKLRKPDDLGEFLPTFSKKSGLQKGLRQKVYEYLCELLIPFEKDFKIELDFSNLRPAFTLEGENIGALLGLTTNL